MAKTNKNPTFDELLVKALTTTNRSEELLEGTPTAPSGAVILGPVSPKVQALCYLLGDMSAEEKVQTEAAREAMKESKRLEQLSQRTQKRVKGLQHIIFTAIEEDFAEEMPDGVTSLGVTDDSVAYVETDRGNDEGFEGLRSFFDKLRDGLSLGSLLNDDCQCENCTARRAQEQEEDAVD